MTDKRSNAGSTGNPGGAVVGQDVGLVASSLSPCVWCGVPKHNIKQCRHTEGQICDYHEYYHIGVAR